MVLCRCHERPVITGLVAASARHEFVETIKVLRAIGTVLLGARSHRGERTYLGRRRATAVRYVRRLDLLRDLGGRVTSTARRSCGFGRHHAASMFMPAVSTLVSPAALMSRATASGRPVVPSCGARGNLGVAWFGGTRHASLRFLWRRPIGEVIYRLPTRIPLCLIPVIARA